MLKVKIIKFSAMWEDERMGQKLAEVVNHIGENRIRYITSSEITGFTKYTIFYEED